MSLQDNENSLETPVVHISCPALAPKPGLSCHITKWMDSVHDGKFRWHKTTQYDMKYEINIEKTYIARKMFQIWTKNITSKTKENINIKKSWRCNNKTRRYDRRYTINKL